MRGICRPRSRRGATVAALTAVITGLSVTTASAEDSLWDSYIFEGPVGFKSRTWSDEKYSEVIFRNCSGPSAPYNVKVQMHRYRAAWPDDDYDTKTFTKCFDGYMAQSYGEWNDLPDGRYYFELAGIGGSSKVNVEVVFVDNTAAD